MKECVPIFNLVLAEQEKMCLQEECSDEQMGVLLRVREAWQVTTTLFRLFLNPIPISICADLSVTEQCVIPPTDQDILERAPKSRHISFGIGFWFFLWVWLGSNTVDISPPTPDILWIKWKSSDIWTCDAENEKKTM